MACSLEPSTLSSPSMLNAQLVAQIGLLMFRCLELLVSSDSLFKDKKEEEKLLSLLDDYRDEKQMGRSDVEWMMSQNKLAYERYLCTKPGPDLLKDPVVENDVLMHELENISEGFKHASQCFGFDVPEYNNAFQQYDEGITEALHDAVGTAASTLNERDLRYVATDIRDGLKLRVQVAFGAYPEWRFRVPVLTPSTFGAMADTFKRFPNAITEARLPRLLPMSPD